MSGNEAIQQRVEAAASWYDSRKDFDSVLIHYSWLKIKQRARSGSVLELGSADGLMTEQLIRHFKRVVVVEGAAKNVSSIRKAFPQVHVHHSLFETFETNEKFDDIIAARVLEHLDEPVRVLRQMHKHLAPDGRLHVVVPNADSFNRKLGLAMGLMSALDQLTPRDISAGHVRVYRRDLLVTHLREAGFEIEELTGTFFKPLANSQMLGWDEKVLEGLYRMSDELPGYCAELYAVCRAV